VRRVRHRTEQGKLFPTWDYHAFVTDGPGSPAELDAEHRRHAVIELAILDAGRAAGWITTLAHSFTMALVGRPGGRDLVVLEGHVRLTALVMAVEHLPAELTVLLGTSPTMRK
jgi:hypothetical protein